jgi:hypothetical protein
MNELNGEHLIRLMSRPEWDDEVLALLELCGEERVDLGDMYSKDIYIDKFDIELEFNRHLKSEKQRAEAEAGNFYLQGVSFYDECTMSLPFGLQWGDKRNICAQKINDNAKIVHLFRYGTGDDYLLEDEDKKYFFKLEFTKNEGILTEYIVSFVWNIDMDLNENYMEDKISIEEALHA